MHDKRREERASAATASGTLTICLVSVVGVHSAAEILRAPVQLLDQKQFAVALCLAKASHECLAATIDAWRDCRQIQPPTFALSEIDGSFAF
jgi:hypothetical protein